MPTPTPVSVLFFGVLIVSDSLGTDGWITCVGLSDSDLVRRLKLKAISSDPAISDHNVHRMANLDHIVRHDEYYLQGGDLFCLVENTIFRIHSYFFMKGSPTFREELVSAPLEPGKRRKGSEESNAIQISNATPQEFADFLWVFYNNTFEEYGATVEKWTSIVNFASAHDFPEVQNLAVRMLEL